MTIILHSRISCWGYSIRVRLINKCCYGNRINSYSKALRFSLWLLAFIISKSQNVVVLRQSFEFSTTRLKKKQNGTSRHFSHREKWAHIECDKGRPRFWMWRDTATPLSAVIRRMKEMEKSLDETSRLCLCVCIKESDSEREKHPPSPPPNPSTTPTIPKRKNIPPSGSQQQSKVKK